MRATAKKPVAHRIIRGPATSSPIAAMLMIDTMPARRGGTAAVGDHVEHALHAR
jgi:hypothetical protein